MTERAAARTVRHEGHWFDIIALFVMGATWGLQPALVKAVVEGGIDEVTGLTVTLAGVAVVFILTLVVRGKLFQVNSRYLRFFAISGALGYLGPLLVAFAVAEHISAGLLTLIGSTTPVFTVLLAFAVGIERVTARTFLAVAFGCFAALFVLLPENALPNPEMVGWAMLAFAIPLFYSFDNVYIAWAWPKELDALQAAAGEVVVATLLLLPFCLLRMDAQTFDGSLTRGWPIIIALVLATAVEVYLFFYVIRARGAVFASFGSFVTIFAGFLWGYLLFDEQPTVWIWASVGLFCVALGLVIKPARAEQWDQP